MSSDGVAGLFSTNSTSKPLEPVGVAPFNSGVAPVAVDKLPIVSEAAPTTGVAGVGTLTESSGVAPTSVMTSPISNVPMMKKNIYSLATSGARMDGMKSPSAVMAPPQMVNPAVMAPPEMVHPAAIYNEMLQSLNKIVGSISIIADKYAKRPNISYTNNMAKKQMAKSNKNNTAKNNTAKNTSAKNTSATNTSATNTSATNEVTQPTNEYTNTNSFYQGGSRRNKKSRSLRKKKGKATRRKGT